MAKDYLNFIDVSSWHAGLNLEEVFKQNPLDGVIVKSTGGTSHVQKTCDPWVQWLIKNGKPWGFYHYMDDDGKAASGKKEAEFFVRNTENYWGDGLGFADYEGLALNLGTGYLLEFLQTVRSLTGFTPGFYTSLSVIQTQDFREIAAEGFPLWLAQYKSNTEVCNFNTVPYQQGSYAPFDRYIMHQYSANGRLGGYNGALDLDRFKGTLADWNALVGKTEAVIEDVESAEPAEEMVNISLPRSIYEMYFKGK